jgi:geranylgeranyl diphosphate synthase type 3
LRRGNPCAHLIFGIPATINSANYMYFEALKDCAKLKNSKVHDIYMDELLLLHRGQAMDIHWRDNAICPSESQYLEMVKNKTGGLFRLGVGLLQAVSSKNTTVDYTNLVNNLAVLFQILDDYLNLQSTQYHENKSFCEDLTEGKFSFPIIHSINSSTGNRQLLNIVRQHSADENIKKYALQLMNTTKSFEYTTKIILDYNKLILEEIERLGGNDALVRIVNYLAAKLKK